MEDSRKTKRGSDSGEATLRPRARIMRTLGDELISSEMVAVIELVKNAYDADATRVLVRLREPLERGEGSIEVIDDGHGMTLDTVLGTYLEPATSFRRDHVRSEELGRAVTGEKGIGRFAVSRLANELELVSRRPGAPTEVRVLFDWSRFDDPKAYLDEVDLAWEVAEPRDIAPGGLIEALWGGEVESPPAERLERGTVLQMRGLREHWGRSELEALRTGLGRLVSPFLYEKQIDRADRFVILMEAPEAFAELSGPIEPPESLQSPHYVLKGRVEGDGSYDLSITLPGSEEPVRRKARARFDDHDPQSGPFEVELRVWDRDQGSMQELGQQVGRSTAEVRRDLNRAAGVSVYRDGFRVLPYGEPGNDWLNLDARRVQNPTMRLSNNQIVGFVLASQESNPNLRDQTNREGLIHNQAYEDLMVQLRAIIAELEDLRYQARRPERDAARSPGQGALFAGLDLASVRDYVAEKYPQDRALAGLVGETQKAIEHDVERAQEIIVRYRRLATLGQLIDKVLHDGRAPLAKMGNQATLGLRDISRRDDGDCEEVLGGVGKNLETIRTQHDVLATVFRRIEPFGGRRRGRPAEIAVEEVLADSFGVLESDVKRTGVELSLPVTQTKVTIDRAELQEVIVNLIDNSLYWLRDVPKADRRIEATVDRDSSGAVVIVFSDSGPGVPDDAQEHIFDPYYTRKPDGVGLGLSIAGEIVDEYYGGDLELLASGPLPGATFRITLRRRV
jgi:signal transduction histidine kinase